MKEFPQGSLKTTSSGVEQPAILVSILQISTYRNLMSDWIIFTPHRPYLRYLPMSRLIKTNVRYKKQSSVIFSECPYLKTNVRIVRCSEYKTDVRFCSVGTEQIVQYLYDFVQILYSSAVHRIAEKLRHVVTVAPVDSPA